MNYPTGMTKEDWKHIDGEQHHPLCPMDEGFVHDCSPEVKRYIEANLSPPYWYLNIEHYYAGRHSVNRVRVDYCPWCGEDLGRPECICDQITADQKEASQEQRYTVRNDSLG